MVFLNVISSTVFATNALAAYWAQELRYSMVSGFLMLTSWCYHWSDCNYLLSIIDKMAVYALIAYGGFQMWKRKFWARHNLFMTLVGMISANITFMLYVYGYYTKSFCFHPEFGYWYHALMHCFSSLGHHCILLLH